LKNLSSFHKTKLSFTAVILLLAVWLSALFTVSAASEHEPSKSEYELTEYYSEAPESVGADTEELLAAIKEAKSVDLNLYTTASADEFKAALNEAIKISENAASPEALTLAALSKLNEKRAALIKCGDTVRLEILVLNISAMDMIYTEQTAKPLLDKCEEARLLLGERHSKETIDAMAAELELLYAKLTVREDKKALAHLLEEMAVKDVSDFSEDDLQHFRITCDQAKKILNTYNSTEEEVDYAMESVRMAYEKGEKGIGATVAWWVIAIFSLLVGTVMFCYVIKDGIFGGEFNTRAVWVMLLFAILGFAGGIYVFVFIL
jgi:hypothetical protein